LKEVKLVSKNFYISDTHFGHRNIIRYDNRPFASVEEMDSTLIKNWNSVVSSEDTVYILGDISWYQEEETAKILAKLNGHKVLIKGNHDRVGNNRSYYDRVTDYLEIKDNGRKVIMSHYPIMFWNNQFYDSIHLYGHVHNSHQWNMMESWMDEARQLQALPMQAYNVGCMMSWMDYMVIGYREIRLGKLCKWRL
jgi:calcineurin-like phosphoesterase family protein